MSRTRLSDGYTVLLVASGPGLGACASLALAEFGADGFFLPTLLSYYAVALLAFLPGLPPLAVCLARAVCSQVHRPEVAWLLLAPAALVWHVIVLEVCYCLYPATSPIDWWLTLRYAAVLWVSTTGSWAVVVTRRK